MDSKKLKQKPISKQRRSQRIKNRNASRLQPQNKQQTSEIHIATNKSQQHSERANIAIGDKALELVEPEKTILMIVDQRYKDQIKIFLSWNYTMNDFNELIAAFEEDDLIRKHFGMIGIRKILSVDDQAQRQLHIEATIKANIIDKMIEYTKQNDYPQLRLEAAWGLANIASGSISQCQLIIGMGIIPIFVQLLTSSVSKEAAWGIANIAAQSNKYRDQCIEMGAIKHLIGLIKRPVDSMETYCWALSNLCRAAPGSSLPKRQQIAQAIPTLGEAIAKGNINDKSIISDCCWAISYFTDKPKTIDVLLQTKILPILIKYLQEEEEYSIITPTLRIIGNISTGLQRQTSELLNHGIVNTFQKLLCFHKKVVRRETCLVISNINAGSKAQVDAILREQQLIKNLLYLFEHDDNDVKYQVCYVFSNMAYAGDKPAVFQLYHSTSIIHLYINALTLGGLKKIDLVFQCLDIVLRLGDQFKVHDQNILMLQITDEQLEILEKIQYHQLFHKLNGNKYYSMIEAIKASRRQQIKMGVQQKQLNINQCDNRSQC